MAGGPIWSGMLASHQETRADPPWRWRCSGGCLGLTRPDCVTNEDVWKWLRVAPIEKMMREARQRWYGHVMHSKDNSVSRKACNSKTVIFVPLLCICIVPNKPCAKHQHFYWNPHHFKSLRVSRGKVWTLCATLLHPAIMWIITATYYTHTY